jgi:glycosyltransferase involved in cell wall biosynthesis
MKIAFVSTRGIPNNYGGFEEFAEKLGKRLVLRGHEVIVYNPSFHPFTEDRLEGVRIKRQFSPEKTIGTSANFIYDFLSIRDATHPEKCDAAIICGYTTSAIALPLVGKARTKIITNMDGLEWKRSKWSPSVQRLAKKFERMAVEHSSALIADNTGIAEYLKTEYDRESFFIPYGSEPGGNFDPATIEHLQLEPFGYLLLVGRMEPENNFEVILSGIRESHTNLPTVVVSNPDTRYGKELVAQFEGDEHIRFIGWVADRELLTNLRHFAAIHFHGHSVGGTNPSLLEAMAAGSLIAAHDNVFNRSVLGDGAVYFGNAKDVRNLVSDVELDPKQREEIAAGNLRKIETLYNWDTVADMYEKMLKEVVTKVKQP